MRLIPVQIVFGAIAACLLLGGCAPQQPMTTEQALTPPPGQAIPVPPGARIIAAGHYPLAPFVIPADGGMIYVYDVDTNRVDFVNSYPAGASNGAGDLTQLSKNSFDSSHNYRVYYLPTPPASRPSGTGQY